MKGLFRSSIHFATCVAEFHRSVLVRFGPFWSVLARFGPCSVRFGPFWSVFDPFWSVLVHFGPFLTRFGPLLVRLQTYKLELRIFFSTGATCCLNAEESGKLQVKFSVCFSFYLIHKMISKYSKFDD